MQWHLFAGNLWSDVLAGDAARRAQLPVRITAAIKNLDRKARQVCERSLQATINAKEADGPCATKVKQQRPAR
eukprot:5896483-Lingulodinium_polyedra.AAC.1